MKYDVIGDIHGQVESSMLCSPSWVTRGAVRSEFHLTAGKLSLSAT